MTKAYTTGAFIFRRDLCLQDNTGLREAFELADRMLPCFIFDPRQQPPANEYFSAHSFQFLTESLEDLARQLVDAGGKLCRFKGLAHEVVSSLIEERATVRFKQHARGAARFLGSIPIYYSTSPDG